MKTLNNNKGFTLIEIIAVLLIMSIITVVVYKSFDNIGPNTANITAGQMVSDMNIAALAGWTAAKFSNGGWISDENVLKFENYSSFPLNNNFLTIGLYQIKVNRIPSEIDKPARWEKEIIK